MRRLARLQRLGREPGEVNHVVWTPRGLTVVIAPWNFPFAIPMGMVSAALVASNTVLFKPSERAPAMGMLLGEILFEAGVPPGVLTVMPGGPELGQALVEQPEVEVTAFTGSKDVGLRLVAQGSELGDGRRAIQRVIAEMGGKNAIIIDDTADLDEAVQGVVSSFTGYQGQKCSACSRAIVLPSVHDAFTQRLKEAVLSLRIGPADEPGRRMGPMIDARAVEKLRRYIEIGKQEGRLLVERGSDATGFFVGPVVFADIQPHHRLAQEEIFGPVLAIMRARDFSEALQIANGTVYALTGGLYSQSPAKIQRARESFDVGKLYINWPITGAWSVVNRPEATASQAWERRPAGRIISPNS